MEVTVVYISKHKCPCLSVVAEEQILPHPDGVRRLKRRHFHLLVLVYAANPLCSGIHKRKHQHQPFGNVSNAENCCSR